MRMTYRPVSRLLALLAMCSLAACHAPGGAGYHKATPTPTRRPAARLSPQSSGSTYTLKSNPSGLSVQRVDPSVTNCVYFFAATQATDTPQTAPHHWNYVFGPTRPARTP